MEPQVASRLSDTRAAIVASPRSAAAWGRFGMVCHAHELWEESIQAYRQAESLDPEDVRWPYYLGDVLSVVGTDPAGAEQAFRRAIELRPGYAPAHMRLGNVLVAADRGAEAAEELEQAIRLDPDLEPARVTLAQVLLSQGELARSASLLERVLEDSPRHGRALSTLGQVYMRLGRREAAREIAERAKDAASYNLFADPLMGQVVAEGVSAVQLWDRAKSFLDNGNYRQAAVGLGRVVELMPDNADVHLQLAVAYGHLDEPGRARGHLERAVALDPDRVDARLRLAGFYLDREEGSAARDQLSVVLDLDPGHRQAAWLLGRARALAGDLPGAVAAFENARSQGLAVPTWAHNEWGSALARTGAVDAALAHFRAVLDAEPGNARALFSIGLVLEGRGQVDQAVAHYCRSIEAQPNSPATSRIRALGRSCSGS